MKNEPFWYLFPGVCEAALISYGGVEEVFAHWIPRSLFVILVTAAVVILVIELAMGRRFGRKVSEREKLIRLMPRAN